MRRGRAQWWAFVLVAYVPVLLADRGRVSSDTKSYLYLDPARYLAGATSMWDSHIGLGTVTHQKIGYLFPMGPYYWLLENVLRVPPWIAQRLWLGTLIFAAGMGVRYLLRTLNVDGPGVPVAMLAYAFTPYVTVYSAKLSTLLGPWAALPWFIAFAARALRSRGWLYPALIALTVQLVGSVNATALICALVGPAIFALYAVVVTRESDWARLWSAVWRTALLTLLSSLWWLAGLWIESGYGLNVLRFTEQITNVSATAFPTEIIRGLGYWLFYGRDFGSIWNGALPDYTENVYVVLVTLLIPALAMLASATVRWRYRLYFAVLVIVGVAMAVGAAPYDNPSIIGAMFKSFAASSTFGLALRSTSRATPLVVLALAALLATGINALSARARAAGRPRVGLGAAVVVGALVLTSAASVWNGSYYTADLERGAIPDYWRSALKAADARPHDTRLMSMPGANEAAYTWGNTVDPIEPGLIQRPFVARELVPMGSVAGADLLQALDGRLQEGVLESSAVAPIARLMGVGDVLLRGDLRTDRYGLIPITRSWQLFSAPTPPGLGAPQLHGSVTDTTHAASELPDVAAPPAERATAPPAVAVFPVEDPLTIVRTKTTNAPVVVAGDGEGLIDLASAGLLDARRLVLYSGSYADRAQELRALPADSVLVLTDSNRRRAQRAGLSIAHIAGYTEAAGEKPLVEDLRDQRLLVFPGETDASRTVDHLTGIRSVRATSYGTMFGYAPSARPVMAIDGDPNTAWYPSSDHDERLELELAHPITTDRIGIVQPATGSSYISAVDLSFDGAPAMRMALDASAMQPGGQVVRFPKRRFGKLVISIEGVRRIGRLGAVQPLGVSEIRLVDDAPGSRPIHATESMRVPTDLLDTLGASSGRHPLVVALSSESTMDRTALRREFTVPTGRDFSISGTAVLSPHADGASIDRALGLADADHGGVAVTSSHPSQTLNGRARNALDGDPTTAWNTPVGTVAGEQLHVELPTAGTIDHLDLQLVADGNHSVATEIRVTGEDGSRVVTIEKPPIASVSGGYPATVHFAPLHGRTLTVEITKYAPLVRAVGSGYVLLPAGIAELGVPDVQVARASAQLPATCDAGLFSVDGRPISVSVTGTTDDALHGRPLAITPCGDSSVLHLGPGTHHLVAEFDERRRAASNGFDLHRLVLASAAGGAAAPATTLMNPTRPDASAPVHVLHEGRTSTTLRLPASDRPQWLVFGQSLSEGWRATIDGHDLGTPRLVDGFANGWRIPAALTSGHSVVVHVEWTPQRSVWIFLGLSLVTGIACLAVVAFALVRRRRTAVALPGADGNVVPIEDALVVRPLLREPPLPRRSARTALAVGSLAVAAALLVEPWVGLLVGVVVLWSILSRWGRLVTRYAPAVMIGGIAVSTAVAQAVEGYATGTSWPATFSWERIPVWIAIFLLLADALVDRLWRRTATPADAPAQPRADA